MKTIIHPTPAGLRRPFAWSMEHSHEAIAGDGGAGWAGGLLDGFRRGDRHRAVTLDGAPLKEGLIKFVPADGKSPSADAVITDGKFSTQVPFGDKRVLISASKVTGKQKMYDTPDSPVVDKVEELLPGRYNVQSELEMEVMSGQQTKTFDLKSK